MSLATKLVSLRKQKGLTQMALAEKLDVSRQAISRWEVGAAVPSMDNLKVLSELYGVPIDSLMNKEDDIPCNQTRTQERKEKKERKAVYLIAVFALLVLLFISVWRGHRQNQESITPIGDMKIVEDEYSEYTFTIE